MWQRFTERARKVVFYAQEEAQKFGEGFVSTEHLLLGLARQPDSVGARALQLLGVSLERVRAEVVKQLPKGDARPSQDMTLTPRAKRVIDLAYEEARKLKDNHIGSEHILLGMIREGDGMAGRVLAHLGVEPERAREAVVAAQSDTNLPPQPHWAGFSDASKALIASANTSALSRNHAGIYPAHLLEHLLQEPTGLGALLAAMGCDRLALMAKVVEGLGNAPEANSLHLGLSERSMAAVVDAWHESERLHAPLVEPTHLLLGLATTDCLEELGCVPDIEAGRAFLGSS